MSENPVAVITGASKGIGLNLAEHFLSLGYEVFGCSRGETPLQDAHYYHLVLDVGDEDAVSLWVRSIKKMVGRIDVLVCNAAYAPANALFLSTPNEMLNEVMDTNVRGTYLVCREVAKVMMIQKSGRIVTVSSMAVGLHAEGTSAYAASKSAIVEMTKILAKEMARFGITCNVIAPSIVQTDSVKALGDKVVERALSQLTIKREVTMGEINNVVDFFVSHESRIVTGQVIHMGLVV